MKPKKAEERGSLCQSEPTVSPLMLLQRTLLSKLYIKQVGLKKSIFDMKGHHMCRVCAKGS